MDIIELVSRKDVNNINSLVEDLVEKGTGEKYKRKSF